MNIRENSRRGKISGKGKIVYNNYLTYEGNFVNGLYDGFGVLKVNNGIRYECEFKNNMMDG
jgi:hypothetical protein